MRDGAGRFLIGILTVAIAWIAVVTICIGYQKAKGTFYHAVN